MRDKAVLYIRNLDAQLMRRVKATAALRGLSLREFIGEALERIVAPQSNARKKGGGRAV